MQVLRSGALLSAGDVLTLLAMHAHTRGTVQDQQRYKKERM